MKTTGAPGIPPHPIRRDLYDLPSIILAMLIAILPHVSTFAQTPSVKVLATRRSSGPIDAITFSATGGYVLIAGPNMTELRNAHDGRVLWQKSGLIRAVFADDSNHVLAVSASRRVSLLKLENGKASMTYDLATKYAPDENRPPVEDEIQLLTAAKSSPVLCTYSDSEGMCFEQNRGGKRWYLDISKYYGLSPLSIGMSPDGATVLVTTLSSSGPGADLWLLNAPRDDLLQLPPLRIASDIFAADFSTRGNLILLLREGLRETGSIPSKITCYDLTSGRLVNVSGPPITTAYASIFAVANTFRR